MELNKFLVGRDGKLIEHFDSKVTPEGEKMTQAVDVALAAKPQVCYPPRSRCRVPMISQ